MAMRTAVCVCTLLLLLAQAQSQPCPLSSLVVDNTNSKAVTLLHPKQDHISPLGTATLPSDGSILVLGKPTAGPQIFRFTKDGEFIRSISVDIKRPSSFMFYEPEGPKSALYAAVDHETSKMFVWSIDEQTTALTQAKAKKTFGFPFKTGPRAIKGYDPVSKMFFIFNGGVIQRAKVNAAGNALELFTPPGGNATFYTPTGGGNDKAARLEAAQILRIYPDPIRRGQLLLFGIRPSSGAGGGKGMRTYVAQLAASGAVLSSTEVFDKQPPYGVTVQASGTIRFLMPKQALITVTCPSSTYKMSQAESFGEAMKSAQQLLRQREGGNKGAKGEKDKKWLKPPAAEASGATTAPGKNVPLKSGPNGNNAAAARGGNRFGLLNSGGVAGGAPEGAAGFGMIGPGGRAAGKFGKFTPHVACSGLPNHLLRITYCVLPVAYNRARQVRQVWKARRLEALYTKPVFEGESGSNL